MLEEKKSNFSILEAAAKRTFFQSKVVTVSMGKRAASWPQIECFK